MKIRYDDGFWHCEDSGSRVFEVFPEIHGDSRGFFCELFKSETGWTDLKQVNLSRSAANTVRGCHAQSGRHCQAKMVRAVNERLYDVITDGRPDSGTFGKTKAYVLDPDRQNMLFVPKGFLHAFCVPPESDRAFFEYFCDNVYDRESETGVNPMSVIPEYARSLSGDLELSGLSRMFEHEDRLLLNDKDILAERFDVWTEKVSAEYAKTGKVWYKGYEEDIR